MITTHTLGFPRMGAKRELKFAVESFWKKDISEKELMAQCKLMRKNNWQLQADAGITLLPVNDFSLYDHILDMSLLLGVIPERFGMPAQADLDTYFQMARGGNNASACEMTKWFDTNYHYIVPEFSAEQTFRISSFKLFDEIEEARSYGHEVKPVIPGPLTYLWLGKAASGFNKLDLLPQLTDCYKDILAELIKRNIQWVQMDEPILVLDLPEAWRAAFSETYRALAASQPKILLATYFGDIEHQAKLVFDLPVAGVHIDAVRAPRQTEVLLPLLGMDKILSVGTVDGRNIWRTDFARTLNELAPLYKALDERLWIASSCSLLHVPVDLDNETALHSEVKQCLAFAKQKTQEIAFLARALEHQDASVKAILDQNKSDIQSRLNSTRIHNPAVSRRCKAVSPDMMQRKSPYAERKVTQEQALKLPLLPTTTIGSFPQTGKIRSLRKEMKSGRITQDEYTAAMKREIDYVIAAQARIGLDVLVHGEPERNDMVEYFAGLLDGFALTQHGWVQSYGSRCVKPPVIYGDISRPQPMTLSWIQYAQSLTKLPVKGMLTGPVTMFAWSFVRNDQSEFDTAQQLALVLRDEVCDLEKAGIKVIQMDEPAFREKLPLRQKDWDSYLSRAAACFRLSVAGVRDETQIHTHMCYSEFNDIIEFIAAMDADVISIETSRSNMELLEAFKKFDYPNSVGPGVYDIHSPRIPAVNDMVSLIEQAAHHIPVEQLWINPDCGLKTREWPEVETALKNMVEAAKKLREKHADKEGSWNDKSFVA